MTPTEMRTSMTITGIRLVLKIYNSRQEACDIVYRVPGNSALKQWFDLK